MTPQDHNKVIGIMHLIYGGFNALVMIILVPFFLMMLGFIRSDPNAPPEVAAILGFMGALLFVFAVLFGLPPLLAGYAMLKRKSWARVAGVAAACVEALSFPFGTALCVYTLWFLFGQGEGFHRAGGGQMYGQGWQSKPLPDANTYGWDAQRARQADRQREYVPPPQPPDWRGQ
ncbi:MAG: hypothetical protein ABR603_13640 [Pyrinomonadaceae bacterium]